MADGDGGTARFKIIVELGIVILQVVITLVLLDIRGSVKDHEARIDTLEIFRGEGDSIKDHEARLNALEIFGGKGNRWTAEQHDQYEIMQAERERRRDQQQEEHEIMMAERLGMIWSAIKRCEEQHGAGG